MMWLLVDLLLVTIVVANGFGMYYYVNRRWIELRRRVTVKTTLQPDRLVDSNFFWARVLSVVIVAGFLTGSLALMLQVARLGAEHEPSFLKISMAMVLMEAFFGLWPFIFAWHKPLE